MAGGSQRRLPLAVGLIRRTSGFVVGGELLDPTNPEHFMVEVEGYDLQHLEDVLRRLSTLRFPLKVYRGVGCAPGARPQRTQGGEYCAGTKERGSWTFDPWAARSFAIGRALGGERQGEVPWMLTGLVEAATAVDWDTTVAYNILMEEERELVLRGPGSVVNIKTQRFFG